MKNMEVIYPLLIFYMGGLWQTDALSLTGEVGKDITIRCSHTNAFSNIKYFCRGACDNEDILISTKVDSKDSQGRYSILDEGNIFYVTISHLTEEDSGTYRCGINRIGFDTYKEVILTVIKEDSEQTINTPGTISFPEMLAYIGAALLLLVLVLATALLIFFKRQNRNINTSPGKCHNTVYATPSSLKEDTHGITTSSLSAKEEVKTDGRNNSVSFLTDHDQSNSSDQQKDNCYSNIGISSEARKQSDSVLYANVSLNKHADDCAVTLQPAEVTYSTVKHRDQAAV